MGVVASETYTSTSTPIQYAAVSAFLGDVEIEKYLFQARRILGTLGTYLARQLKAAGVSVSMPVGAFYLFPDFSSFRDKLNARGIKTSEDLCDQLLHDVGVAILPGSVFGRSEKELSARIAYVDFDGARALIAAQQVPPHESLSESFIKMYCQHCIKAINSICEWLHQ